MFRQLKIFCFSVHEFLLEPFPAGDEDRSPGFVTYHAFGMESSMKKRTKEDTFRENEYFFELKTYFFVLFPLVISGKYYIIKSEKMSFAVIKRRF